MWRSKTLGLIFKCSRGAPIPSPTPRFSSLHFQNIKFFSINPNAIDYDAQTSNHSVNSQQYVEGKNPIILFKENDESNEKIGSSLLQQKVFEEMPERNNEQVEIVLSVLQSSLDGSLESNLDKMDLTLNDKFMVRVIETPLVPGESLIQFFKWALKKSDFSVNFRVVDCLVKVIGAGLRKKEIHSLWDLIKGIGEKEKGVLDTEILNQLISLFWKLGRGNAGLEVFDKIEEFGCDPNAYSYYFTIEALYRCSMFDEASSVCEKMLNAGKLPDSKKIGNIISCFCKGNKAKHAHLVYLMAKGKSVRPPLSSIKDMIRVLSKDNGTVKLALDLLDELSGDARKYAIKLFSSVLFGLCNIKDTEESKKLLFKMIKEGPPPGNAAFNSVIKLFSKAGQMEEVMDLVDVMELRGLIPDVYTYCVIMSGYARKCQMEEACRVLSEAKKNHSKLSPVAYHILTRGYCKLKEFDKALELFNEMKDNGIQPNADEYNKMIQSLCLKALNWRTAEKLLEEMKQNGLHFNGITQGLVRAAKELEESQLDAVSVTTQA